MAIIFPDLRHTLRADEPPFEAWAKPAAVMVLLARYPEPAVLLIHRPDTLTHHAGQIACPGGSFDPRFDHSLWDAACRETEEEVGIQVPQDAFAGFLDSVHIGVTGYTLLPAVAVIDAPLAVHPNPDEVAAYQWVSLREMRTVRKMSRIMAAGVTYRMPEFPLAWGRLWGATARVMDQLLGHVAPDLGESLSQPGVKGAHQKASAD